MDNQELVAKIEEYVEPIMAVNDVELVDVFWGVRNGRWTLCLFIDKEQGVDIADCERVNHEVSDLLDRIDIIPHSYVLEISSPGLERPLKKKQDFLRFKGADVKVTYLISNAADAAQQKETVKGTLMGIAENSGDDDALVQVETIEGKTMDIKLADILKANLWFRPDKDFKEGRRRKK